MQKNLYIFMQLPSGRRTVTGRLIYEKLADGHIQSYFRYEASWLTDADVFPLDPVNLPLTTDIFEVKSRTGLWGVMEDALPDAWGRRLLQARHMVEVTQNNNIELLLLTGWAEPGATGFGMSLDMPDHSVIPMDLKMTGPAMAASRAFEKDGGVVSLPDFFISGGSSAGGARPKVLARSGSDQYLVKFPSINDPAPEIIAQLEFFGLSSAKLSGIPVPDFFLITPSANRTALAVHRFDTAGQGRRHFLSFQSLVGIEAQLGLPYSTMAEIIKKISVDPEQDLYALYKQMAINVILCNCDDHLKNFSMLYDTSTRGFCLTPAYDIVPNLWQREHILSIAGKTTGITSDDLIREGRNFSISRKRGLQLLNEAADGVSGALAANQEMLKQLSSSYSLCHQLLDDIRANLSMINTQ
jgi:serine/threonine-protein kinase HipA